MNIKMYVIANITSEQLQWVARYTREEDSAIEQISIRSRGNSNVLDVTSNYYDGSTYTYLVTPNGEAIHKLGETA